MSDEKAHTRWHMGPGMVVVTDEAGVSVVEEEAAKRGVVAKEIGRTTSSGLVVIRNTGYYRDQSNEWLTYPIGA
jgi:phosphoribosylaminoimidazole (AIR) synthetase